MIYEEVNGIIIGGDTWPYEFWITYPTGHALAGLHDRVARGHFSSDGEAIDWFKANYPEQFAAGVEMRVFDK